MTITRPQAGSMEDVQQRVALATRRRRAARLLFAAGHIRAADNEFDLAEAMFLSAAERFIHNHPLYSA